METKNIRLGPGDLGLLLGYVAVPREPYPPEMREVRERVFAACRKNRVAFLETVRARNHSRQARRGRAGHCRAPRGNRAHWTRPSAPHDARLNFRRERPHLFSLFRRYLGGVELPKPA